MATSVIVSLQDMKTHLRYPSPSQPTSDDAAIQQFIDAAEECIRFECDETLPRLYEEQHDGGRFKIFLDHRPVLSVKNIQESWGWINYELDFQAEGTVPEGTSMWGYSIDNYTTGEIARRSVASVPIPFIPGERNIRVTYVAGYDPVPATIVLAIKELVAHWWQNSQLRAVALAGANIAYDAVQGAAYTRDTESGSQNLNIGVPYRILEMIKGYRRLPIIA